jgi:hypothetical protein
MSAKTETTTDTVDTQTPAPREVTECDDMVKAFLSGEENVIFVF